MGSAHVTSSDTIQEVSEPASPEEGEEEIPEDGPSILTSLLKRSPPQSHREPSPDARPHSQQSHSEVEEPKPKRSPSRETPEPEPEVQRSHEAVVEEPTERTPLIPRLSSDSFSTDESTNGVDVEGQKQMPKKHWFRGLKDLTVNVEDHIVHGVQIATSPKIWDRKVLWQNAVVAPVSCLPAVIVGLLLNVLDALSYGKSGVSQVGVQT